MSGTANNENLNALKDDELVLRAQKGDKLAEEALLVRYAGIVRSKAREFFLAGGETEDLIQEGMIGLYRAVGDYRVGVETSSFKNFAYLCVRRRIIDAVKSSARKKNVPLNNYVSLFSGEELNVDSAEISPEETLIQGENRREFMQKMSGVLSDFEFKIIVMYMNGMSCAEICAATNKGEKSVDNALQRGKKKLLKLLKR